uniref:hypothetical protein n=1 Tax=Escherichia coli TaxID=562 RepID=UPI0021C377E2|nr:hypothetical protein [Escherichia coli]CAH8250734.1 Uncharacterised protein [Escherichia coli]
MIVNITDDDILVTLSVRDSVWQRLAETVWTELTQRWPEEAITTVHFETLAGEHSETWRQLPSGRCRSGIREKLENWVSEPLRLFSLTEEDATDEDIRAASERDTVREVEYRAVLPALHNRQFSTLSQHEKALAQLYRDRVTFTPDGAGDFVVSVTEGAPHA